MTERACPACGGANPVAAVFCAHCDKALGDFSYLGEVQAAGTLWHESLAERATGFIGKPHFVVVHAVWFTAWVVLNMGFFLMVRRWDAYPFNLLGVLLAMESIFISGFVLISQNRQSSYAKMAARLNYEVDVRTYREIVQTRSRLDETLTRLDRLERAFTSVAGEKDFHDAG